MITVTKEAEQQIMNYFQSCGEVKPIRLFLNHSG
jgi:hypothetical protein